MSMAYNKAESAKITKDYKIFKLLPFQRPISLEHVRRIEQSIKDQNMLHCNPIIVDKNLYVIDGQHRLLAAKNLKLPIFYSQLDFNALENPKAIVNINIQERWKWFNYVDFYKSLGYPEYIKFQNLLDKYGLAATIIVHLAKGGSSGSFTKDVKNGDLKFPDDVEEFLDLYAPFCFQAKNLILKQYHPILKSQAFAAAHLHCFKVLGDRYANFLQSLKKGLPSLVSFRLIEDYLKFFAMHANKGMKQNRYDILEPIE